MFDIILANNYIEILESDANVFIKSERMKYKSLFEYILSRSNELGLIVSNNNLLLDKHDYWEFIQLYHHNAHVIVKTLIADMCQKFGEKFMLRVSEFDKTYTIEYNTRRICAITNLSIFDKYSIYQFIKPQVYKLDKNTLLLLPPILEIISLYTNLYNLDMAAKWVSILEDIKELEVYVKLDLQSILSKIENVEDFSINSPFIIDTNLTQKRPKKAIVENLNLLLLDFISMTDYILVDDIANALNKSTNTYKFSEHLDSLDIISKNTIEFDYAALSNYLSKFTPNGIVYKEKPIYLQNEFIMKKHSFYILYKTGANPHKKHILNIYNNSSFELISFSDLVVPKVGNFKLADPVVQLKFTYLNIWSSVVFQRISKYDLNKFKDHIEKKMDQLELYKTKIDILNKKENFIGIYKFPHINKKQLMIDNQNIKKGIFYCFDIESYI